MAYPYGTLATNWAAGNTIASATMNAHAAALNDIITELGSDPGGDITARISKTIVDAKGDLIAATAADTVARVAVGTNDQALVADSTASTGVKWVSVRTNSERRGVVKDGVTNNATIFQAILDAGEIIELPQNAICVSGPLTVPKGTGVIGPGVQSCMLKGLSAATAPLLKISTHARATTFRDFTLDGGGAASLLAHGLVLDNSAALDTDVANSIAPYVDGRHMVSNLIVQYTGGTGIMQLGRGSSQFSDIQIWNVNGDGIYCDTDCAYVNIDVGAAGWDGFYIVSGSNRFTGCKAWYSGRVSVTGGSSRTNGTGHGFHPANGNYSANTFAACGAQDNARAGFYLNNCGRQEHTGCEADSNNTSNLAHANVEIISSSRSRWSGISWDRSANATKALAALRMTGGGANNIDMIVDGDSVMGQGVITTDTETDAGMNYNTLRIDSGAEPNPAYAAAVTLPKFREDIRIGTLTGAITISPPAEKYKGQKMMVTLTQDATGGRVVTWAAGFKVPTAVPTTANSVSILQFTFDGTDWRQSTPTVTTT